MKSIKMGKVDNFLLEIILLNGLVSQALKLNVL